jgi:AraC-like DNA-binding protein
MDYREYTPSAPLAPFIQCYWSLSGASEIPPPVSRVFPDGCMEIIFHFAETFSRVQEDGRVERQADTLIAGQIWAPLTLQPGVRADVLGIRFRPTGAMPFLRFPLHEASGRILSLEEVWGNRARTWRDSLGGARDRIAVLESHLLACRPEPVSIPRSLSPRQFRRRFQAEVGLSPKLYERIRRFQRALGILGSMPFAEAAAACGYYDQSHLIRDFQQFTGERPSAWLQGEANVLFHPDALEAEATHGRLGDPIC